MADYIKECEEKKMNYDSESQALTECGDDLVKSQTQFWQSPSFYIGTVLIEVPVTLTLVCAFHVFGACK